MPPAAAAPHPAPPPRQPFPKVLALAWAIEGAAVLMGLVLAVIAGVEGGGGRAWGVILASLPFVMLALIELTKIPIVGMVFAIRSRALKALGVAMLAVVTVATFENFVFGFERAFHERTALIERETTRRDALAEAARLAERDAAEADAAVARIAGAQAAVREEMEAVRRQAREDVEDARRSGAALDPLATDRERLARERLALAARRDAELARERRACAAQPAAPCNLRAVERAYAARIGALDEEEARLRGEILARARDADAQAREARAARGGDLAALQARLDALGADHAAARAEAARARDAAAAAGREGAAAEARRADAVARSQLHRLAGLLGTGEDAEGVARVKAIFVASLAAIVAVIGSVVAALHYAAERSRRLVAAGALPAVAAVADRRPVLRRALRALLLALARRRRVRVVEKRVEVPVERLKVVYLPVDAKEGEVARLRAETAA